MNPDSIVAIALLGTSRSPGLPEAPHASFDVTWQGLAAEPDVSIGVIKAAALEGIALRSGGTSLLPCDLLPIAAPETQPYINHTAVDAGVRLLTGEHAYCLPEWAATIRAAGLIVPPIVLPKLLDAAKRSLSLREDVGAISGRRGQWLATQLDQHSWIHGEGPVDDEQWETGSHMQRIAWFRQQRSHDPAAMAKIIADLWNSESGEMRESIVALVSETPHQADESWLEKDALRDRRQSIRHSAIKALGSMDSAFRARAKKRIGQILSVEKHFLSSVLRIAVPTAFVDEWEADAIGRTPPKGVGQHAWWARQILAQLPFRDWANLLGISLKDLVSLDWDTDWEETLDLAAIESLRRYPEPESVILVFQRRIKTWRKKENSPVLRIDLWNTFCDLLPPGDLAQFLETGPLPDDEMRSLLGRFHPSLLPNKHPRLLRIAPLPHRVTRWIY